MCVRSARNGTLDVLLPKECRPNQETVQHGRQGSKEDKARKQNQCDVHVHFCEKEYRTKFYIFDRGDKCLMEATSGAKLNWLSSKGKGKRMRKEEKQLLWEEDGF